MNKTSINKAIQYRINWERIFKGGKIRGSYYPVPSETGITVVQYAPDFKISCLFPPKKRKFTVEYRSDRYEKSTARFFDRKITTPTLMMSHLIRRTEKFEYDLPYLLPDPDCPIAKKSINHHPACYCQYCKLRAFRKHRIVNQYYLFAVDDEKSDSIWAQPYRLNNVYEDGRCCFKKESSGLAHPENLRQAHVQFWLDRFDNDFTVGVIPHKCTKRYHRYRHCGRQRWNHICWNEGHHDSHTCHEVDIEDTEDEEFDGCFCCEGTCSCESECECCQGRCDCASIALEKECACECCLNVCGCSCTCYLGDAFADKLANYIPDKAWLNYTKYIFGKQYLSTSKKTHGVFFSADPELLQDIPKQFHKKHDKYNHPFIIGFVKECKRGINIDLHSEVTFNLGLKQYDTVM